MQLHNTMHTFHTSNDRRVNKLIGHTATIFQVCFISWLPPIIQLANTQDSKNYHHNTNHHDMYHHDKIIQENYLSCSPASDIAIYSPISISAHSENLESADHYMAMDDLTPHVENEKSSANPQATLHDNPP